MKSAPGTAPGLFSKIAGSFSAAGLNILSAQIFTPRGWHRARHLLCHRRAGRNRGHGARQRERSRKSCSQVLTGDDVDLPALIAEESHARPLYQSHAGERIPDAIRFDNELGRPRSSKSRPRTASACSTDFAGVQELEVDISVAKILTEKGAAIDTFYVRDILGDKIMDPAVLKLRTPFARVHSSPRSAAIRQQGGVGPWRTGDQKSRCRLNRYATAQLLPSPSLTCGCLQCSSQ